MEQFFFNWVEDVLEVHSNLVIFVVFDFKWNDKPQTSNLNVQN